VTPFGCPIGGAIRGAPLAARRSTRPTQAYSPRPLAYLELAETRCAELGDERREELIREPVDRDVIRGAFCGIPLETGIA
jgi:hypothetical protein